MVVQEMHIGIDLATQMLNSSALLKLAPEAKDYYLNKAVRTLIKEEVGKEANNNTNASSHQDILGFYNRLAPLIYSMIIPEYSLSFKYQSFLLPTGTQDYIISGDLESGIEYRVVTAGTTNLTYVGYKSTPIAGEKFVATTATTGPTISAYVSDAMQHVIDIVAGRVYKIKTNTSASYTSYGAANNNVNTIFTSTFTGSILATLGGDSLYLLSIVWNGTVLEKVFTYDYGHILSVTARIDSGQRFNLGNLVVGNKYRVVTAGATNLSSYGHTAVPIIDTIFECTLSGTPIWDGVTYLIKVVDRVCRLHKPQDSRSLLDHSYGTTFESPTCDLGISADGVILNVYNDGSFVVNDIFLTYVKKPDKITLSINKDCNLGEDMHDEVVQLAALIIKQDDDRLRGNNK
jgi:hypothetical protein